MTNEHKTLWHKHIDEDNIVCLSLDVPDSNVNILTSEVIDALSAELDILADSLPRGLIICSAKESGFIAGADIKTFAQQHSIDETFVAIKGVHKVLNRLESLDCPTVAVIHGFCLGGGLELALACRYRLADDGPSTRIGLPEVKLGIHPGYGGSVRLIELIGVIPAMTLMLTGRTLSARAAQKMTVIDQSLPKRYLQKRARELILQQPPKQQASRFQQVLSLSLFRPLVAVMLRKKTASKVQEKHYPSPFSLISLWQHQPKQRQDFLTAEALSVAKLIGTETAQNLVRTFFLQERLKSFAKQAEFQAHSVHVIGAGIMGGDIAAWCALRGLRVTLQDQTIERIAPAIDRAHNLFKRQLKTTHAVRAAMDRLSPDVAGMGISKADVVIEAIFENLTAKQALLQQIEPQLQSHAILATNTSSIPLEDLASCLQQDQRLVGLHFFNPVAKMQLIEIVSGENTDKTCANDAAAFARQIGRLPLPVKSSAGFLVNRILMPYLLEAVKMVAENIDIETIDRVATDFGMPIGPIELADTVGLDICLSVATVLAPELGFEIPEKLEQLVSDGHLGRKSGQGFYVYKEGKKQVANSAGHTEIDRVMIEQRLILRLVNECVCCLSEGIVEDADLIDAGMVFGTGFAPFRGGPMSYLHQQGAETIVKQLEQLCTSIDSRFAPKPGWGDLL